MENHHRRAAALLQAAATLESEGRPASAAALRRGLDSTRLLLALAAHPCRPPQADPPRSSQVRVATILDAFSANSFEGAFTGIPLLPKSWRDQLATDQPQIFLCESAWTGADMKQRPWSGRIHASNRVAHENRTVLLDILAYCRQKGIVTVFWNKEDPTHYGDRAHDFVRTATEFDHVFTSAQECVAHYKADYGLTHVHALPFATNPRLFPPVETHTRSDSVTFAGGWYAHHEARCADMHRIFGKLISSGLKVEIYDRFHGATDPKHIWPQAYLPFLRPAVPHADIARIYKAGRFALNINTVTHSRTMFARRVFELMSSHTLVLSNHSVGIEEMFGRDVVFCDREPERLKKLGSDEIDAMRERNLNLVLSQHTYRHRWEQILRQIAHPFQPAQETLTIVWPMRHAADAQRAQNWFSKEADSSKDRLLLVCRDDMSPEDVRTCTALRADGLHVTRLQELERPASAAQARPVETDYILLHTPEHLPPDGWLARARLHLQYAGTDPIGLAADARARYRHVTSPPQGPLLFRSGHALDGGALHVLAV